MTERSNSSDGDSSPAANVSPTKPRAPLAERVVKCMQDEGLEASVDWQGSVTGPEMTTDQYAKWSEISSKCSESVGYFNTQLTLIQKKELYAQELKARECLAENGYPSDEPPSEQQFIDTWGGADQYSAYFAAGGGEFNEAEARKVVALCPPPSWFLNLRGL